MSSNDCLEFKYKGHEIQVYARNVPGGWLGDPNTVFSVFIDSASAPVPGIWDAYQLGGEKGIKLVIQALLDVA